MDAQECLSSNPLPVHLVRLLDESVCVRLCDNNWTKASEWRKMEEVGTMTMNLSMG